MGNEGTGRFDFAGLQGPVATILPDGINIEVRTWGYVDPGGYHWTFTGPYLSDGASIPRECWSLIGAPLTGVYRIPALGHDYLYRHRPIDPATHAPVTKDKADTLLLDMMRCAGVDAELAQIIYEAVSHFGSSSWNGDQSQSQSVLSTEVHHG